MRIPTGRGLILTGDRQVAAQYAPMATRRALELKMLMEMSKQKLGHKSIVLIPGCVWANINIIDDATFIRIHACGGRSCGTAKVSAELTSVSAFNQRVLITIEVDFAEDANIESQARWGWSGTFGGPTLSVSQRSKAGGFSSPNSNIDEWTVSYPLEGGTFEINIMTFSNFGYISPSTYTIVEDQVGNPEIPGVDMRRVTSSGLITDGFQVMKWFQSLPICRGPYQIYSNGLWVFQHPDDIQGRSSMSHLGQPVEQEDGTFTDVTLWKDTEDTGGCLPVSELEFYKYKCIALATTTLELDNLA